MNKKEVYELKIDPKNGLDVGVISLVTDPAISKNYLTFSQDQKAKQYQFSVDNDKYEILGIAMIPDQLIPRFNHKTNEEFDVYFSAQTIRDIAQNFFLKNYHHQVNLEHSNTYVKAHVWQSYIVDRELNIDPPKGFEDVPNGSWVVGMKLDESDPSTAKAWQAIKDNSVFKGFSIEGYFVDLLVGTNEGNNDADDLIEELLDLL